MVPPSSIGPRCGLDFTGPSSPSMKLRPLVVTNASVFNFDHRPLENPPMITSALFVLNVALAANPPAGRRSGAEDEVRSTVQAYVEAYNRGDVDTLASFFLEDAEYVTDDGDVIKGRDKIRQELGDSLREAKGARLDVRIDSIELPRRDMAIVRGTATLRP